MNWFKRAWAIFLPTSWQGGSVKTEEPVSPRQVQVTKKKVPDFWMGLGIGTAFFSFLSFLMSPIAPYTFLRPLVLLMRSLPEFGFGSGILLFLFVAIYTTYKERQGLLFGFICGFVLVVVLAILLFMDFFSQVQPA